MSFRRLRAVLLLSVVSTGGGSITGGGNRVVRSLLAVVLVAVIGCDIAARGRGTSAVLPDTQTVDGVLEMRHDADAFARAPRWVIDTAVALAVVPTAQVSSSVSEDPAVLRLPNGAWAMMGLIGGRLVLFDSTGGNPREYWPDQRPGGRFGWSSLLTASHDTVVVIDGESGTVHRYTLDGRMRVDSHPGLEPGCLNALGLLPSGRMVARRQCVGDFDYRRPAPRGRAPTVLVTTGGDFTDVRPFATLPGIELGPRPARSGQLVVELGQRWHAAVWDAMVVTATGERGYALDLRTPDGEVTRRLVVDVPRRLVTDAMRTAGKARWGDAIVADTMPPFARIMVGTDGLLWVVDAVAPTDSGWTATAFRRDGAIVGRLTAAHPLPDWFGAGQVMHTGTRAMKQHTQPEFHVKAIIPRAAR